MEFILWGVGRGQDVGAIVVDQVGERRRHTGQTVVCWAMKRRQARHHFGICLF